jgi:hypothetical protein
LLALKTEPGFISLDNITAFYPAFCIPGKTAWTGFAFSQMSSTDAAVKTAWSNQFFLHFSLPDNKI